MKEGKKYCSSSNKRLRERPNEHLSGRITCIYLLPWLREIEEAKTRAGIFSGPGQGQTPEKGCQGVRKASRAGPSPLLRKREDTSCLMSKGELISHKMA